MYAQTQIAVRVCFEWKIALPLSYIFHFVFADGASGFTDHVVRYAWKVIV